MTFCSVGMRPVGVVGPPSSCQNRVAVGYPQDDLGGAEPQARMAPFLVSDSPGKELILFA